jgi:hypothetical protein
MKGLTVKVEIAEKYFFCVVQPNSAVKKEPLVKKFFPSNVLQ